MAQGPTVVATIKADDQAGAVFKKLATEAQEAVKSTSELSGRASRDAIANMERMSARHGVVVDTMAQRFGAFAAKADKWAAGAFAGLGLHFLHEASHIATEMSGLVLQSGLRVMGPEGSQP